MDLTKGYQQQMRYWLNEFYGGCGYSAGDLMPLNAHILSCHREPLEEAGLDTLNVLLTPSAELGAIHTS